MPRCCSKASTDEARIPCNCRAPCIQVIKSKPTKKGWTLWCGVDFKLVSALTFTLMMIAYVQPTVNIFHGE
eukprot:12435822-Ditylum_brightwellii.AAC.1